MRVARFGWLALVVLLPGAAARGWGQAQPAQPEPQIVRVSYVQGDVRVSRGKDAEKITKAEWEKAAVDLPIEAGYSLVTGDGRAEIEFEDASVVYLAENSVLTFNDLHAMGGIPQTELALLSGTMTIQVKPMAPGERFVVRTPTERFAVRYPDRTFLRVTSYLDGMKLTGMGTTLLRMDGAPAYQISNGQTMIYRNGERSFAQTPAGNDDSGFDQWVQARAVPRNDAMAATMKDAGLTSPLPGLAELRGQGTFSDCAPYGRCWEPANGWAGQVTPADKAAMAQSTVSVAALQQGGTKNVGQAGTQGTQKQFETIDYFPCSPLRTRNVWTIDSVTGKRKLVYSETLPPNFLRYAGAMPYEWAVCHTGSWIRHEGRYKWVAGTKRHHHWPVHWVKDGHRVGYVPIHPRDVAGKPPVNLKEGIIHPVDKTSARVEMLSANAVKLLDEAPKAFRSELVVPLERAEAPHATAYSLTQATASGVVTGSAVLPIGTPVTFDRKTQSFMVAMARPGGASSGSGGATRMVVQPIGGRGSDVQVHSSAAGYSTSGASLARGVDSSYSGGTSSRGVSNTSAPPASPPAAASSSSSSSGSKK